ncbi:response regulator [Alkaliphilus transvaalensis]|uniref:response regulator n=1 Tax=Alkaliphilus transvaalensis TaxID=114628 RepID=UPI000479D0D2|nr:response regulator [Alkaliphilus transvaalensis]
MDRMPSVLIVDDEVNILRAIKRLLMQYKLEVYSTTSPVEGLAIIKDKDIDVIISDQRMPLMEGIQLLAEVKNISPKTIRILMSSHSDIEVFISAINNGIIFRYISKPWENEKLVNVIYDALDQKAQQDQLFNFLLKNDHEVNMINEKKQAQRSIFLSKLIEGDINITEKHIREATLLDIDLQAPMFCCLLTSTGEESIEFEKLAKLMSNYILWDREKFIGIIHQEVSLEEKDILVNTVQHIKEVLTKYSPKLSYVMGVSKIHKGINAIKKCYHEAQQALMVENIENKNVNHISYFKDIGVFQLLTIIKDEEYCRNFLEDYIGKLIDYDQKKGTELINTLHALLKNQSLKEAASSLFIHPKTIVFRRKRIEELLEISLEDYETRLNLGIAIKLHKLNQERSQKEE